MASPSVALQSPPGHDTFHVVKKCCLTSAAEIVTVVHQVPTGAEGLASFENHIQAIDFAESIVRELRGIGSLTCRPTLRSGWCWLKFIDESAQSRLMVVGETRVPRRQRNAPNSDACP